MGEEGPPRQAVRRTGMTRPADISHVPQCERRSRLDAHGGNPKGWGLDGQGSSAVDGGLPSGSHAGVALARAVIAEQVLRRQSPC